MMKNRVGAKAGRNAAIKFLKVVLHFTRIEVKAFEIFRQQNS